jgi:hypothetical protein
MTQAQRTNPNSGSQRTRPCFKPKWPRLQFLNKKRELDRLDVALDRDYTIQFKPCGGQYASSTS